jgi:hypothetical protein
VSSKEQTTPEKPPTKSATAPAASSTEASEVSAASTKKKRTRRTKAEIEAEKAAEATPDKEPVTTDDDLFGDLDLDDEPEVKEVTQEDVRAALLAFRNALAKVLVEKGTEEKEAGKKAMGKAKDLLNKVAGTEVLGSVTPDKYGAVVAFANEQLAKLEAK